MAQMTWRVPDELLEQVRHQARAHGRSLNEWVTTVMSAATDPAFAADDVSRVRERLARAGLLEPTAAETSRRPDPARVEAARRRAGTGRPLSELVSEQRR